MTKIDVDDTVRKLEQGTLPDWISDHLRAYVESGGAEGHLWDSTPVGGRGLVPCLVLTTVGRKSGEKRASPLIYGRAGEAFVVVGSKGGSETNPAWYGNLLAEPRVELQVGTERFAARARVASGAERARLWAAMLEIYPPYADYQAKTAREIPVVVFERESGG
jgi:deazaflavin-dependent oxidoreductase (nitroreductase family)